MKNLDFVNYVLGLFISSFLLFSCSSDDSSEGGGTASPTSIELKSNLSSGTTEVNKTVIFTVTGNDGKDYTDKSTFYHNGEILNSKSHKFTQSGTHEFKAKMNKLTSNTISITVENEGAASQPTAITLSSSAASSKTNVNEPVTFKVMGDNGTEYTSLSTIKINGESIEGNQHTFTQGGTSEITAVYNDLNSNTLALEVLASNYLSLNKNKVLRGQEVSFDFFGSNGEKATADATFYVNGNAISGNTFSSGNAGVFEVTAKNASGVETEAKTFEVFIPKRKALFEDYTGTWCGWCPRVTNAVLLLKEKTEDLAVVALHFQDKMELYGAGKLISHFQIEAFPHARLNRTSVIPFPEDEEEQLQTVLDIAGVESPYSIAINTNLKSNGLEIKVKLISETQIPQGHKLVVYILQNGVIFPQANYLNNNPESRWYLKGDPIKTFVHDDVLEVSLTDIFGDKLEAIPAYQEAEFTFGPVDLSKYAYALNGNYYNPHNFEVVAILTSEDNTALNAQKVTAGHNVEFE